VQVTEFSTSLPTSLEEQEFAAVVAAISVFIESENKEGEHSAASNWGMAAKLEAAGAPHLKSNQDIELARRHLSSLAKTLVAFLLCAVILEQPAHAFWLFKHHKHQDNSENVAPQEAPPSQASSQNNPQTNMGSVMLTPYGSLPTTSKFLPYGTTTRPKTSVNRASELRFNTQQSALQSPSPSFSASPVIPLTPYCPVTTTIRVALLQNAPATEIIALDGAVIQEQTSAARLASLSAQTRWTMRCDQQAVTFKPKDWYQVDDDTIAQNSTGSRYYPQGRTQQVMYRPAVAPHHNLSSHLLRLPIMVADQQRSFLVTPNGRDGLIGVNGKFYRGSLLIQPAYSDPTRGASSTSFNVINTLNIEDYLLSVVPSEMPSGWPQEALRAQAVAARTYAYANLGKHGKDGFDVRDTTDDQVYSGVKAESNSSNQAVASTRNVVMTFEGKAICAYFHSASGGTTESAENVWGKELPYLKAVPDYDNRSPHALWTKNFSVDQLETSLAPNLGQLLSVVVLYRTSSQRANQVLLVGSQGSELTSGEAIRRALKLPSTNFNVNPVSDGYSFEGHGFGHGLGLSQWGARSLAEQGYNAAQILTYYYRNIALERFADVPGH
jgi:stage II sporulation protein D